VGWGKRNATSFANPAVTIARALGNTFAGIAPRHVPAFLVAELLGALAAAYLFRWLFEGIVREKKSELHGLKK
jgi:glycerol uptake facilitator-like aquaporin